MKIMYMHTSAKPATMAQIAWLNGIPMPIMPPTIRAGTQIVLPIHINAIDPQERFSSNDTGW